LLRPNFTIRQALPGLTFSTTLDATNRATGVVVPDTPADRAPVRSRDIEQQGGPRYARSNAMPSWAAQWF
jgi:hypothetical protein